MSKHLIIAGHGTRKNKTFDPGATGFITKGEHKYVKEDLFPAMKKHLPKGHNLVFFDSYNVFDHGNIVALARQHGATQVTEIHYDAASASARGGHVIIDGKRGPDKIDLALRDAIDKMVGVRYTHRGHKGISGRNNLANVNRSVNASYAYRLIELGFGTNQTDADIMTNKVDEYAKALVEAITGSVINAQPQTGGTQVSAPAKPASPKPSTSGLLQRGSKGKDVKALQEQLLSLGYKLPRFGADSDFGKETEDAVKAFQKDQGIGVDGIAGPDTFSKLAAAVKSKSQTKEYVSLPASAATWRTYRTNVQPVAKNSDWSLTPKAFGGLEYEIIGKPQKDVVTINTSRGKRNIYVAPSTGARIFKK